jgi:hypothetical protein
VGNFTGRQFLIRRFSMVVFFLFLRTTGGLDSASVSNRRADFVGFSCAVGVYAVGVLLGINW